MRTIQISDYKIRKITQKMKELEHSHDTECSHANADNLLVGLIREMGLNGLADAYCDINKWYA